MIIALLLLAYLLGSIPFGLLLTRMAGLGDVRQIGSGNIGATNVMRTGRKGLGIATLLCDAGKGFAAVWLLQPYDTHLMALAGLFAILGHIFPVWLRFKGGKGVATAIGVLFGLNPMLGLCVCLMWAAVFIITGFSSLASIISLSCSAIAGFLLDDSIGGLLGLAIAALVIYTHRGNIQRLREGTEKGFKKTP